MKKIAIVGVGTIIYQDEGIGVYAAKYIKENYQFNGDVTIIDGGVLGFHLMQYYQEYDKVIILDTITINDNVGSIYNLPAQELFGLGAHKQSAHEVEIVDMFEMCSLMGQIADICVIGIVPHNIKDVSIDLSDCMKKHFPKMIKTTLDELSKDITYSKNKPSISLEQIIYNYAHPSQITIKNHSDTNNKSQN